MRKLSRRVLKSKAHARRLGRKGAFTDALKSLDQFDDDVVFAMNNCGATAAGVGIARHTLARCMDLIRRLRDA